jgi:hypothetical protein
MIETWGTPNSSNIATVIYDDETRTGTITFRSGGTYTVDSVDKSVLEEMVASPSPGAYFNRHVKNTYRVKRA